MLKEIIGLMDNDTTLLLYGDHGMTNDGNHGGGTQNEIKTTFFAYSKGGLPMLKREEIRKQLLADKSVKSLKQLDISSIASFILEQPVPFSSLGILHPLLHMSDNISELPWKMLGNLKQIQAYIDQYCEESPGLSWCELQIHQLEIFIDDMALKLSQLKKGEDTEAVKLSLEMHAFANDKYKVF